MSTLVYVAGAYTFPDPATNTRDAILVAERLYNDSNHELVPFVPHCNLVWNLVAPHEVGYWYQYDLDVLEHCGALLRIPGESWGADEEVKFAEANDIPVFYGEDDLLVWAAENAEAAV